MILYHKPRTRFSIDHIRYGEPKLASYRSASLDHPLSVEGVGYRVGFEYDDKIWNSSYSESYDKVSVRAITDEGGEVLQRMNYTPYGRLANADGKPYTRSEERMALHGGALMFGRGYTGHEHLLGLGLINMNARLYDPYGGRFLSPDPYVQLPDFSQNFNRYSYCLNNPLSFTDQTGEFWHLIIGAAIGGVVKWGMNGFRFDAKGLGYFGVGALAGALGAGIGGLWGGIDAARDGRRFWDGATVQRTTLAEHNIPVVGQIGTNDCLPASVEAVDRSFGGGITQQDVRGWPGLEGNAPLEDVDVWSAYGNRSGHFVTGEIPGPGVNSPANVLSNMQSGNRVAINLSTGDVGHSVVMQRAVQQTATKINGNVTQKMLYYIMNPASGGSITRISSRSIINAYNIFYVLH